MARGYLETAIVDAELRVPWLGEIGCPVLVVHSEQDVIPLADKELIVKSVKKARLVTIADSHHVVIWDQAARFNEALLAFLGEVEPRAAG